MDTDMVSDELASRRFGIGGPPFVEPIWPVGHCQPEPQGFIIWSASDPRVCTFTLNPYNADSTSLGTQTNKTLEKRRATVV